MRNYDVSYLFITHGARGSTCVTRGGRYRQPGEVIDMSSGDAVGAGDAFTAVLAHHLLRGKDPLDILSAANHYAGRVASRKGGMPDMNTTKNHPS